MPQCKQAVEAECYITLDTESQSIYRLPLSFHGRQPAAVAAVVAMFCNLTVTFVYILLQPPLGC